MTFLGFFAILAIIGIMAGGLYVSKLATIREEEEKRKKAQVREIRNNLIDIDELIHTLLVYDRNTDLISALIKVMKKSIENGLKLEPEHSELIGDLSGIDKLNLLCNELQANPSEPETPGSDQQIFIMKKHFIRAIKMIKRLHLKGDMPELNGQEHRTRLFRNSLILEVKAYRVQGDEAKQRGEVSSAANYFKHAKEVLTQSETSFKGKSDMVKDISASVASLYETDRTENNDEENNAN